MSNDSKIEQKAYEAIEAVINMIWPKQRERILKNIVIRIMMFMKWDRITLGEQDE